MFFSSQSGSEGKNIRTLFTLDTIRSLKLSPKKQWRTINSEPIPTCSEECYNTTEAVSRKNCETIILRWIMKVFLSRSHRKTAFPLSPSHAHKLRFEMKKKKFWESENCEKCFKAFHRRKRKHKLKISSCLWHRKRNFLRKK